MAGTTTSANSDVPDSLTPLEQEVLDEYALLLENLNKVLGPTIFCKFTVGRQDSA